MSKKVAGLPVPVLGGIIIAGVLLGLWLRHRSASSSSTGVVGPSSTLDAATLGALTNAAAGGSIAPTGGGLDPTLAGALAANQDALVNQTNYLTGLLGANVQASQGLASSVVGSAFDFANHFLDVVPVYTYGSSPAGSSPTGTSTPPPPPPPPSSPPPASIAPPVVYASVVDQTLAAQGVKSPDTLDPAIRTALYARSGSRAIAA